MNVVRTHTPLHLAARNGHMNVVSYFLSCGMDVNITVSMFPTDSYLRKSQPKFVIKQSDALSTILKFCDVKSLNDFAKLLAKFGTVYI